MELHTADRCCSGAMLNVLHTGCLDELSSALFFCLLDCLRLTSWQVQLRQFVIRPGCFLMPVIIIQVDDCKVTDVRLSCFTLCIICKFSSDRIQISLIDEYDYSPHIKFAGQMITSNITVSRQYFCLTDNPCTVSVTT